MTQSTKDLSRQLHERLEKGRQTRPSDINPLYEELKTMGYGWEAYVYLVRDQSTGRKLIVKVFHEPPTSDGLKLYADRVKSNQYGLSPITLLQGSDGIVALQYPFVRLHHVNYRMFSLSDCTAKSLFGQFCLMQWYLMSHHGIGLTDPRKENFLLTPDGQFHYIDYGRNIFSVTDPRALDRGLFGHGFAMLLLGTYNINLKLEMPYSYSYSYSEPCIYNQCKAMDIVATGHAWVRRILSEVRSQDASIFLDPEFYWRLGVSLPRRVPLPQIIILASVFPSALKNVRELARTALCVPSHCE